VRQGATVRLSPQRVAREIWRQLRVTEPGTLAPASVWIHEWAARV